MARVTRASASTSRVESGQAPVSCLGTGSSLQSSNTQVLSSLSDLKSSKADSLFQKRSQIKPAPASPNTSRKRPRAPAVKHEDVNELPHNLGSTPDLKSRAIKEENDSPAKRARKTPTKNKKTEPKKPSLEKALPKKEVVDELVTKATTTTKKPSKKNANYGLTPGQTPYPDWPHPTPEECEEVTRLLSSVHGEVKPPKEIPAPSLTVSGCGEVPSVLDALIRTRLSAATSGTNSSRAFAGLVETFGVLKEGVGKGSVDWNKVRLAKNEEVFEAIKSGGLATVKSKDINQILQMVWEENQARREELLSSSGAPGSNNEAASEKNTEIAKAEENVISLDHLHLLSNDDALAKLMSYPGIGPKTASCVLLFCMQRPSFAVDTHVFRLCQWLNWVPPAGHPALQAPGSKGKGMSVPTREKTYSHCEVRIPDNLKYPLHQLFIKHGKTCPRCRAITGENSEGWNKGCVIDHLVQRTGARKGGAASPSKSANGRTPVKKTNGPTRAKAAKGRKSKAESIDDDESEAELSDSEPELSELSDLGSDDEDAPASSPSETSSQE